MKNWENKLDKAEKLGDARTQNRKNRRFLATITKKIIAKNKLEEGTP